MLLGARALFGGKGVKWVNPYITDGLIAMWDGEWNVGGGKHDASATVWKDLVGNYDVTLQSAGSFESNNLYCDGTGVGAKADNGVYCNDFRTMEICTRKNDNAEGFIAIFTNANGNGCLEFGADGRFCFGYYAGANAYASYSKFANGCTITGLWDGIPSTTSNTGCYIDGAEYTARTARPVGFGSGQPLGFGARTNNGASPINCNIYSVRLYNRALTADEVAHNYSIDQQRFGV